jgi:Arc/MetJ-type ribon-helix-helix transcriptional regulator
MATTQAPEEEPKSTTRRVQFDFSDASLRRLDQLKEDTHSPSRAEVVRRALALLETVVEARKRDEALCIERKDGKLRELSLF